jgi:hypothetical protein
MRPPEPRKDILAYPDRLCSKAFTEPELALSSPPMMIKSDDLPEPEDPVRPTVTPALKSKVISFRI